MDSNRLRDRLGGQAAHRLRPALQALVLFVFAAFVARAVTGRWHDVRLYLGRLSPGALSLAMVTALAATWCSFLSWRAVLADFGARLPLGGAMRVFFPGQLGKYVPGKVWTLVTQARAGERYGVPARASAAAATILVLLMLATGLLLSVVALPLAGPHAAGRYRWALATVPLALACLHPAALNRALALALRLARRAPMPRPLTGRGMLAATAWCLAMWALFGAHLWVLALDLGQPPTWELAAYGSAAYAASWAIGFLLLVTPAGAGPREAASILLLSAVVPPALATVITLASRLIVTLSDAAWGVGSLLAFRLPARERAGGPGAGPLPAAPPSPGPGARERG